MRLTALVFDVGGVLLDWNPRRVYQALIPDPAELAALHPQHADLIHA